MFGGKLNKEGGGASLRWCTPPFCHFTSEVRKVGQGPTFSPLILPSYTLASILVRMPPILHLLTTVTLMYLATQLNTNSII